MKKIFLCILSIALVSNSLLAQESKFTVSEAGLTDYIVVPVDSMKSVDIYSKCIEWVGKTYKSPEDVIKSKIEGNSIRIEGSADGLIYTLGGVTYLTRYQVEISFRDGRYKFDVLSIETYANAQYGWNSFPFMGDWAAYYKNGEPRKAWVCINDIPVYFNNLSESLKSYILNSDKQEAEKW
jgi:hypothetical protein